MILCEFCLGRRRTTVQVSCHFTVAVYACTHYNNYDRGSTGETVSPRYCLIIPIYVTRSRPWYIPGDEPTNIRDKLSPGEACLIHDPDRLQIGAAWRNVYKMTDLSAARVIRLTAAVTMAIGSNPRRLSRPHILSAACVYT